MNPVTLWFPINVFEPVVANEPVFPFIELMLISTLADLIYKLFNLNAADAVNKFNDAVDAPTAVNLVSIEPV